MFFKILKYKIARSFTDSCPRRHLCQRGGYPNPARCSHCLCPGGLGGQFCTTNDSPTSICPPVHHLLPTLKNFQNRNENQTFAPEILFLD